MKFWIFVLLTPVSGILSPLAYPDLWLPMDVIQNGILKGRELDANLQGSPQLVPAVFGNGLMLNMANTDDWANFGNIRHTCFGNPEKCPDGFTLSLWLQLGTPRGDTMYIISSGGQTRYSFGIVLYARNSHLHFWCKTHLYEWRTKFNVSHVGSKWFHTVLVWKLDDGSKMYFNGELMASSSDSTTASVLSNSYNDMVLGATNRETKSSILASCILDDVRMWYQVLGSNEIKRLADEGFFTMGLKLNSLITDGKFVNYKDNDTTCTAVQAQQLGVPSSLVKVTWDYDVDIFGLENVSVWLSGDVRQDYLQLYMAKSSNQPCATMLSSCDLNFRTPMDNLWRSFYNCTCPTRDCTHLYFRVLEDAKACPLTWTGCLPILICNVTVLWDL